MKQTQEIKRDSNQIIGDESNGREGGGRPFLEAVARAYADNFDDLSEICFVFPNKRAGVFFLRHLHQAVGDRTVVAPEVTSITDFVAELSGRDTAPRVDLLFRLYNIYKETRGESGDLFTDFDAFRSWGETLLSDFSEVDQYNVDADSLFKNVKDYREIASNFLTPEQLEVMERYFGYRPGLAEVEGFWKKMIPDSEIKSRFLMLWQQMAPLYHALNESLAAEGLCTSGGAYRIALERLREHGRDVLKWKKVVMVGFNALSTTEALIFEELRGLDPDPDMKGAFGEFFWDGTGPVLSEALNDAATFLKYNRRNFPQPAWAREWMVSSDVEGMPEELRAIAAPSNAAQAKIAGAEVKEIVDKIGLEEIGRAKTAVVLPDENLLMPLLYALPEELESVNLTMGYPLRNTSVISFISHLRKLYSGARILKGEPTFYHADLRIMLSHPYVHALIGSNTVSRINARVAKHHLVAVPLSEIAAVSEKAAELLLPPAETATALEVIAHLDRLMIRVSEALEGKNTGILKSRLDRSHIDVYRGALQRLAAACRAHGIEMKSRSVFAMVDQLLAGEQVTFEGEPLAGLQVMGLLETRALDFDNLVILSMNDKVMPRKALARTFIPDSLRHGYGLPWSNYREDLFSYYFYRMISRAKSVTMIYDARAGEGMRSGGMSRYLMQLQYLYAPSLLKFENHKYLLNPTVTKARAVEKTDVVTRQLEEFTRHGSSRNLSASALKNYFTCPVKFYYENVCGIKTDTEESEYVDAITQGNVVHEVMLDLYFPPESRGRYLEKPILMTADKIDGVIHDRQKIHALMTRALNKHHFHRPPELMDEPLEGATAIVGESLEKQVVEILTYDRSLTPFLLEGGEIAGLVEWPFGKEGRRVNLKYAIDRLDILPRPGGGSLQRIVDYKTGKAGVAADSLEGIFDGSDSAKNLFQLMLYANLMNRDRGTENPVKLSIYEVSSILKGGEVAPTIKMEGMAKNGKPKMISIPVETHLQINEDFISRTNEILDEIFDPERPFIPADDDEKCKYCHLGSLCGRTQ